MLPLRHRGAPHPQHRVVAEAQPHRLHRPAARQVRLRLALRVHAPGVVEPQQPRRFFVDAQTRRVQFAPVALPADLHPAAHVACQARACVVRIQRAAHWEIVRAPRRREGGVRSGRSAATQSGAHDRVAAQRVFGGPYPGRIERDQRVPVGARAGIAHHRRWHECGSGGTPRECRRLPDEPDRILPRELHQGRSLLDFGIRFQRSCAS
mmetsp:Transcript_26399/g.73834  ORF Transcript_26399/g.73834 Transcript_26399/m.73834 type:complete len:208 (+) Transcript_26399:597-1220(+)